MGGSGSQTWYALKGEGMCWEKKIGKHKQWGSKKKQAGEQTTD